MDDKVQSILNKLNEAFPNPQTELRYNTDFQLLTAIILSAQCTDKRVNEVTKILYSIAPTPEKMNELPIEELEKIIFPCGFYHSKAKHIKEMSLSLTEKFGGKVPGSMKELQSLSGVGQKTANVMMAVYFKEPAFAVDTHVYRVSHRLGFSVALSPEKTEEDLKSLIDEPAIWGRSHHWLLMQGRYVCKSRRPECERCNITMYCKYFLDSDKTSDEKNKVNGNYKKSKPKKHKA